MPRELLEVCIQWRRSNRVICVWLVFPDDRTVAPHPVFKATALLDFPAVTDEYLDHDVLAYRQRKGKHADLESELAILRADLEAETTAKEGLQVKLAKVRAKSAKEKMVRKEAVSKSAKQGALLESLSCRLAAAEQGVEVAKAVRQLTRGGSPDLAVGSSKTMRSLARVCGAAPSAEGPYVPRRLRRDDLAERKRRREQLLGGTRRKFGYGWLGRRPL